MSIKRLVKKKSDRQVNKLKIALPKSTKLLPVVVPVETGIIFLQARISSSRLPGKVLKTVARKELLAYLIERLLTSGLPVVLLVPSTEKQAFAKFKEKFPALAIFAGAKYHVLSRFYHAAKKFPARNYIRVTGDNPFTSILCLRKILDEHLKEKSDISYYQGLPYGAGVEVVSAHALNLAYEESQTKAEREHVTPWLHERFALHRTSKQTTATLARLNTIRFKSYRLAALVLTAPRRYNYPSLRVTVDTQEDFKEFKTRVLKLKKNKLPYSLTNLLKIVKK